MSLQPSFADFERHARSGSPAPVWRELLFDTESALSAYYKVARPPFGFLLESVEGGERWARYTFLGTEPEAAWKLVAGRVSRWSPGKGWGDGRESADPLADLEGWIGRAPPAQVPGMPRFWGGTVGYLAYDAVRHLESLPNPPPRDTDLPDALFIKTGVVVAIDNLFGKARVIAPVETSGQDRAALRRDYRHAGERIEAVVRRLRKAAPPAPLSLPAASGAGAELEFQSTFTRESFELAVGRIQEYIVAGDVFQAVLSQRLSVPLRADPFSVYRALRALNPSPYLFYLELDGVRLVGSSPEALVRVEGARVSVRPIAGTRPRGASAAEDAELARDLVADPKERAEHLMLLDLGRNDVGQVARYGSVRVSERMRVEKYSHVMHLVSTVEGELEPGLAALDALRAGFPAGTVTGAPKLRAMEIIDELEPVRRGPYAGAVGYLSFGGRSLDTAIAIRTLVARGGVAYVQAGAGIVADSDPAREYQETLDKARALLRAVEMAEGSS
ncbi:MAG: anthranilate synthase component I [Longimicrobiaceae bacterium]